MGIVSAEPFEKQARQISHWKNPRDADENDRQADE
jgi:hypothetical protein